MAIEKNKVEDKTPVTSSGTPVPSEQDELDIAEARRIIASRKAEQESRGFSGPVARVYNGQTTYAVFSKDQYGDEYRTLAEAFAKERQFTVEFI